MTPLLLALILLDGPVPSPRPAPVCRSGEGPRCDCYARISDSWRWVACVAPVPSPAPQPEPEPVYIVVKEVVPEPVATPKPSKRIPEGMSVTTTLGGIVTLAGDAGTSLQPTAFVNVDGPLAVGSVELSRLYVLLGITSAPGESVNIVDPKSFHAAKVELGLYKVIGRLQLGNQEITTSLHVKWSFASRLRTGNVEPVDRLSRIYGGGLRFDERRSHAWLALGYGRDEMVGERGYGQWLVAGQVPIKGTEGSVLLTGDASLMVGPARTDPFARIFGGGNGVRRDILRLGITFDPVATVKAMKNIKVGR